MPQAALPEAFHVEHIVARQHRGPTRPENLALACLHCNLHKGPNLSGIDPDTGQLTRLFHPRTDTWDDHFAWSGHLILGRTAIGRATAAVLAMNHPDRLVVRAALFFDGLLPPAG